jgi:3-dehydroquinate synthase
MGELIVGLGDRSYPIFIEKGCLAKIGKDLASRRVANRYCILADQNVANIYAGTIIKSLAESNIAADLICFPAGEQSKNLSVFADLSSKIAQKGLDRKDGIIALGGGVTGDLAGFIASSYMRGIPFIQIPTSLLAQVDSSVGGKTGVDIPEGKNLVGAFYQPKAVYIDTDVLTTLPRLELLAGMAEVIKYAVIRDANFFKYLKEVREDVLALRPEAIETIISRCCTIKAEIVAEDEQESNIRRILNFGHTIGHAVESVSEFSIIHGNGVAIGMVAATRLAVAKGILKQTDAENIVALLQAYGLPTAIPEHFDRQRIKMFLNTDKKNVSGKLAFILPERIGNVIITDEISEHLLDEVLVTIL